MECKQYLKLAYGSLNGQTLEGRLDTRLAYWCDACNKLSNIIVTKCVGCDIRRDPQLNGPALGKSPNTHSIGGRGIGSIK